MKSNLLIFLLWFVLSMSSPINLYLSLYSPMFSSNYFVVYVLDQQLQQKQTIPLSHIKNKKILYIIKYNVQIFSIMF